MVRLSCRSMSWVAASSSVCGLWSRSSRGAAGRTWPPKIGTALDKSLGGRLGRSSMARRSHQECRSGGVFVTPANMCSRCRLAGSKSWDARLRVRDAVVEDRTGRRSTSIRAMPLSSGMGMMGSTARECPRPRLIDGLTRWSDFGWEWGREWGAGATKEGTDEATDWRRNTLVFF
jgi:hypothetical protein